MNADIRNLDLNLLWARVALPDERSHRGPAYQWLRNLLLETSQQ